MQKLLPNCRQLFAVLCENIRYPVGHPAQYSDASLTRLKRWSSSGEKRKWLESTYDRPLSDVPKAILDRGLIASGFIEKVSLADHLARLVNRSCRQSLSAEALSLTIYC